MFQTANITAVTPLSGPQNTKNMCRIEKVREDFKIRGDTKVLDYIIQSIHVLTLVFKSELNI